MIHDKNRSQKWCAALPPWIDAGRRSLGRLGMAVVLGTALAVASISIVWLSLDATADAAPADFCQQSFAPVERPDGASAANVYPMDETVARAAKRRRARNVAPATGAIDASAQVSGIGGGDLVSQARQYIGTNPTGRGSLWCGAFLDMVLKQTGRRGGGNLARGYTHYGTQIAGPEVGAIVVIGRKGGGHVGIVSGIDANGNPVVISGNHNRRVAESTYPRSRVIAYVKPNG